MIVLFEVFAIVAVIVAAIKEKELMQFEQKIIEIWRSEKWR